MNFTSSENISIYYIKNEVQNNTYLFLSHFLHIFYFFQTNFSHLIYFIFQIIQQHLLQSINHNLPILNCFITSSFFTLLDYFINCIYYNNLTSFIFRINHNNFTNLNEMVSFVIKIQTGFLTTSIVYSVINEFRLFGKDNKLNGLN